MQWNSGQAGQGRWIWRPRRKIEAVVGRLTASAGEGWIVRSDGLNCDEIYEPVADLLPVGATSILYLGAATGRDAAWLARMGHRVTR